MTPDSTFGKWLKQQRKSRDATQEEFARCIGCTVSLLQKIEAGERRPSRQLAALMTNAFDIAPAKCAEFVAFARDDSVTHAFFDAPNNLPAPTTPLIGRTSDVAVIRKRLLHDDTRLLTLVGPPGIGKTRLALAVAKDTRDCFADGVFFVALAAITDVDLCVLTILRTLGVREGQPQSSFDRLVNYLGDKHLLLVLDNLEQIITVASSIAKLLAACPRLKILATSRIALRVRAERQFPVPPLALPNLTRALAVEELVRYPALEFFCDRAQAVNPDFAITPDNVLAVAQICHHLDGLPLAIELITARTKILSPAEILARLSGRFLLQSDGLRDIDERQRTLKNAIEWSYNLLTHVEQTLFARLAVFVGGWTLGAAEQVCGVESTLDVLSSLVNQNLVRCQVINSETRFTMLEIIRECALEKLEERGETAAMQYKHALYFVALAESCEQKILGVEQAVWFRTVGDNFDNIRTVLKASLEQSDDAILSLRLAGALREYWLISNHKREEMEWLEQILQANVTPSGWRAKALGALGELYNWRGDIARAIAVLEEGLTLYQQLNDLRGVALTLYDLGSAYSISAPARSLPYLQLSLTLLEQLDDRSALAEVYDSMGWVLLRQGQYACADKWFQKYLELGRVANNPFGVRQAIHHCGLVALIQGDDIRAEAYFQECLALAQAANDTYRITAMFNSLGQLARLRGDFAQAEQFYVQAFNLAEQEGFRVETFVCNLGTIALHQGNCARATAFFHQSIRANQSTGRVDTIAICLTGLAGTAMTTTQVQQERAVRLLGAASTLLASSGVQLSTVDQAEWNHIALDVQASLEEAMFMAQYNKGRAMTLEQAIEYALAE